ncbi:MAG: pyridoxal-phosphate dependent enzyme [Bacteroidales bacterium]|nr:pyridoxal-phosphate dependent enzyme [Bacteroidales bacterium]
MDDMRIPVAADIEAAYRKIKPYVHKTPVLQSSALNKIFGSELYFKCENFQKVGAFKFRGAINAVLSLNDDEVARGLITHSSGNHAAALSLAAGIRGAKAYIVMPSNSPAVKKKAVAGYGAEIRFCEPNLKARLDTATEIINETGAVFIHAYDNFDVICGQGSAGLELVNEYPDLDIVVGPVGGGGLMSGTAIAVKGQKPGIRVFGAEPLGADDAYRSIKTGVYVSDHVPDTIADGLLTTLSKRTFAILSEMLDDIFTVSDESIINSMRLLWERMKIIVEPSSAVSLAVIAENPGVFKNRKVGIILSGGNVDLDNLPFSG